VVVHGWVYGLHNGLLKDLRMTVDRRREGPAYDAAALGAAQQALPASAPTGPHHRVRG
jgi:carbonic anhydrase